MNGTRLVGVDQAKIMVASEYCLVVAAAFAIVLGKVGGKQIFIGGELGRVRRTSMTA
jgi:hypothetical protein